MTIFFLKEIFIILFSNSFFVHFYRLVINYLCELKLDDPAFLQNDIVNLVQ
jgi:hypothetical protein